MRGGRRVRIMVMVSNSIVAKHFSIACFMTLSVECLNYVLLHNSFCGVDEVFVARVFVG